MTVTNDWENGFWDDDDGWDRCYECGGYGDDYYYDEEKDEWVSNCNDCPFNPFNDDDDW